MEAQHDGVRRAVEFKTQEDLLSIVESNGKQY
jgi:hypothetical protein